jgi:myo-inositol-1(or 4)-monophosphatase
MSASGAAGGAVDGAALEAELLEVAEQAARAAAAELLARWRRPLEVDTKSTPTDPVTEADRSAERAIREVLAARRPQDAILGEEGGATGEGELRWVVDPLDGTVNYTYGQPTFAVSIAVQDAEGGLAAVVLDPVRDELFSATRSGPPLRNGEPIAPTGCPSLGRALVGTGFGYDAEVRALQAHVAARLIPRARDIRRAGVAALDLCACAAGNLDAYYERGVKTWDIAAGTLICQRAGLAVRTLEPDGDLPSGVVVAAPALIDELHALVA